MKATSVLLASAMIALGCTQILGLDKDWHLASETTGGGHAGSSTATTSSSGGAGGAPATSTTTSATTSSTSATASSSSTGPCTTDEDQDGVLSWECDPNDPDKDCADKDARAFPDAGFQAAPIAGNMKPGTPPFDFDCNGVEEAETAVLDCAGLLSCGTETGFQVPVKCGQSASLGHCVASGLGCVWAAFMPDQTIVQHCK